MYTELFILFLAIIIFLLLVFKSSQTKRKREEFKQYVNEASESKKPPEIQKKSIPKIDIPMRIPFSELDEPFKLGLDEMKEGDYVSALKYLDQTSKTASKYFHFAKGVCLFNVWGNNKEFIYEVPKRAKEFSNHFIQGRFDSKSFESMKNTVNKWETELKRAYETIKKALDMDPNFKEARQFMNWMETTSLRDLANLQKTISKTIRDNLALLSPRDFERFIAYLFSKMNYQVQMTTYTADFGADVLAQRGGHRIVIQVKRYIGARVGAKEVQQILGSMWKYKANHAILVTTSNFTDPAREQAKGSPIELWDKKVLSKIIEEILFS